MEWFTRKKDGEQGVFRIGEEKENDEEEEVK